MKRNITLGILFISAIALSSCSTTRLASNESFGDDDMYHTQAKAGDEPVYAVQPVYRDENPQQNAGVAADGYEDDYYTTDDEYYYYDDYASRIDRFSYYSPFGYYDNLYYGYGYGTPYYSSWPYGYGLGLGYSWNAGWNIGVGFGWGNYWGSYGYSPYWPYGAAYGYGYGYGGLGYSYWGTGWGGSPYWGVYSAYRSGGTPRPSRGNGNPMGITGRSNGNVGYYPNRPNRMAGSDGSGVSRPTSVSGRQPVNQGNNRPVRENTRPAYTPSVDRSPAPSSSGRSAAPSGGGSSRGGGRPARN